MENDKTVGALIKHGDGTINSERVYPDQIIYDETGTIPIGVKLVREPKKGDEFVKIEPIPVKINKP